MEEEKKLQKKTGQDIEMGEITLPILNLLETVSVDERNRLKQLLGSGRDKETLEEIKLRLSDSDAAVKTEGTVSYYINLAKEKLDVLPCSKYKESLISLTGFVMNRGFNTV